MGAVISNLKARFSVDNSEFKSGLSDGEKSLIKFDKKVGSSIKELGNMLSPLALLGAAGGAIAMLKGAIESVEGPGDRFEAVMGGGKEALFELQKALGTVDFSGFFSNLKEGFERGKQFTEALDELADRAAYNDYKIAELNRNSEALQEITKDKTKEISVRAAAAEKVKEIEGLIVKRKIELAQEEFNIAKKQWEDRNKMEASEAVKLYETIDNMAPELKKRLQKAFEGAKGNQLGNVNQGIKSVLYGQYDPQLVKEVPKSTLESYSQFFKLLEGGEKDVLIKLFNTFKDIDEKGYQAQKEYNGVIAATSKLFAAEDKALNKILETKTKINQKDQDSIDLEKVKAGQVVMLKVGLANIKMPDFSQTILKTLAPLAKLQSSIKTVSFDISQGLKEALENAAVAFGEFLGAVLLGDAGINDFGKMVLGQFADIMITLGKLFIKSAITVGTWAVMMTNPLAWPLALAAGIALVAIGTAIKGSMASAASGSGGGGGSSSGGSAGGGITYDTRTGTEKAQNIELSGRFTVEGSDLVLVLNQENLRRRVINGR